jgi:hypothetical protein
MNNTQTKKTTKGGKQTTSSDPPASKTQPQPAGNSSSASGKENVQKGKSTTSATDGPFYEVDLHSEDEREFDVVRDAEIDEEPEMVEAERLDKDDGVIVEQVKKQKWGSGRRYITYEWQTFRSRSLNLTRFYSSKQDIGCLRP